MLPTRKFAMEVSGQHENRVIKVDGEAIDLRTGTGGVAPADLRWLPWRRAERSPPAQRRTFERGRSLVDEVELQQELETLLGYHVDVAEDVHHAIRDHVLAEAVSL